MAGASLYFAGDQQDAVLVTKGAQTLHEGLGAGVEVAFILHRFDDDCGDVLGLGIVPEDTLDVGDRVILAHVVQFVGR